MTVSQKTPIPNRTVPAVSSPANRTLLNRGLAVIILVVVLMAAGTLALLHRQAELRTVVTTQNLARSIDQTVGGLIDTIDIALLAAAREIARQLASGHVDADSVTAMLMVNGKHIPSVAHFRATNAGGDILYGSEVPAAPVNSADRDYFIRLRADSNAGLVADQPFLGRINQQWVWTFARRINKSDGSFGGVVFAAIALAELEKMMAQIKLPSGSSVTLRDAELRLLARYPAAYLNHVAIGEKRYSPAFLETFSANPREGSYENGAGGLDGIVRMFSYRRNEKHGFLVHVGLDYKSAFGEWRQQAVGIVAVVMVLSAGLLAFARVISGAWRRQEEAVAASEEAQQIANLGRYRYDVRSGRWTGSAIFDAIYGIDSSYPRDSRHWFELAAAEGCDERLAYTNPAVEQRLPLDREYRIFRRNDGQERWVRSRGRLQFAADGSPSALVGTVEDISERKQTEADLRIAATAFDAQEAMVITDKDSVILRVNRAFTANTGYSAAEAVGQTPRLLKSRRHDDEFFRAMWQTVTRTGGWQGEIWDRRKDGKEYQKWLTISAVKDESGAVTHYVGAQYDITARKEAEEKINALAFFDQLTGLANRTLLLDRLNQAMVASARGDSHCALLFIDLDHFKTLNDTLGHDAGDLLLKQAARRLAGAVREGDTVARLGGDDFVVILLGLGVSAPDAASSTELVARKILAVLNHIYSFGDVAHHSSASIGATLFRGTSIAADELMKQSDLTMYKAKAAGRNAFLFFDPAMEVAVRERAALEGDLRRALDENQFILYYQAQVVGDGRVTGAEVLVRWQHPRRGMVAPTEFIPLAEETGLILLLGHWVLETACRQLALWASRPALAGLTIAVNVSVHQFGQADFVNQVLAVLRSTGANPQRLKLELTESLLVDKVEEVIEKMVVLKARGVGFSLDDFGTGYSSLSYLKRLPLDQLKIDESFIRDVLIDSNGASIARTVVALASSLGLGVIAEGVESAAQRDFLASIGCHAYQGYFFSRPLPVDGFEQFALAVAPLGCAANGCLAMACNDG